MVGLVVNEKVNIKRKFIRNVRAILHCWEKKGLEESKKIFVNKYDRHRDNGIPDFISSLKGKIEYIGMIRGKDDIIYNNLKGRFVFLRNQVNITLE